MTPEDNPTSQSLKFRLGETNVTHLKTLKGVAFDKARTSTTKWRTTRQVLDAVDESLNPGRGATRS